MIALLLAALASATAPDAAITDIRAIAIHRGVNHVQGLLSGGRTATVVQGWRGNGNAHGHNVFLVLTPKSEDTAYGVVAIDRGDGSPLQDTITDSPFDGERVLGVVDFAQADVDGQPTGVLITADLDEAASGVLADHSTATIRIYRLAHLGSDQVGDTPDEFRLAKTLHTRARFCNADVALHTTLGVPFVADHAGLNIVDGCFPAR